MQMWVQTPHAESSDTRCEGNRRRRAVCKNKGGEIYEETGGRTDGVKGGKEA